MDSARVTGARFKHDNIVTCGKRCEMVVVMLRKQNLWLGLENRSRFGIN